MIFDKYGKLAKDLSQYSLAAASDRTVLDFMARVGVTNDAERFTFNVLFANTIICIFGVNLALKFNEKDGKKVLDPFLEGLMKNLDHSKRITIGDYILHKKELDSLKRYYDVTGSTQTNMFSLFDMIYPIRGDEYYKDISLGFQKIMKNSTGSLGPMFPLAKTVIRYHTGDDDSEKYSSLIVALAVLFYGFFSDVTKHCGETLR